MTYIVALIFIIINIIEAVVAILKNLVHATLTIAPLRRLAVSNMSHLAQEG